jgi:hypothetical protein
MIEKERGAGRANVMGYYPAGKEDRTHGTAAL